MDNIKIEQIHYTKFLGVMLEGSLTWTATSLTLKIKYLEKLVSFWGLKSSQCERITEIKKFLFGVIGYKIWNSLANVLKTCISLNTCKNIEMFLLQVYQAQIKH